MRNSFDPTSTIYNTLATFLCQISLYTNRSLITAQIITLKANNNAQKQPDHRLEVSS